MPNEAKHSALPWRLDGKLIQTNEDDQRTAPIANCAMSHGIGFAGERDAANAAFIVRAANSYEAHRALVKAVLETLPNETRGIILKLAQAADAICARKESGL